MKRNLIGAALLLALLAVAPACDNDSGDTKEEGGSGGGQGGAGGSGGSGPIECAEACVAPEICDGRDGACKCACSIPGETACAAGLVCDTASCACVEPTGTVGTPCETRDDCAASGSGAQCLRPGSNGIDWVAGYCTVACDLQTNPCAAGSVCTGLGCLDECEADADCGREDYSCVPIDETTDQCGVALPNVSKVCFPTPASTCSAATTGGACTDDTDCRAGVCDDGTCRCSPLGGRCITSDDCLEAGFCTGVERTRTEVGEDVISEGYCLTLGVCDPMRPHEGCGPNGRCEDADGTNTTGACIPTSTCNINPANAPACTEDADCAVGVCDAGACSCSPIGGRCDFHDDCVRGGECFDNDGFPGGYCVIWDCDPDANAGAAGGCPTGSSCVQIGTDADPHTYGLGYGVYACFADCTLDPTGASDCRAGYACERSNPLAGIGKSCRQAAECEGVQIGGMDATCAQGVCGLSCRQATEAEDCPAGWSCMFDSAISAGLCIPRCDQDGDCETSAGEFCAELTYTSISGVDFSCTADAECQARVPGASCLFGTLNQACTDDAGCPSTHRCDGGVCTTDTGTCLAQCDEDSDCPITNDAGEDRFGSCHNGACVFSACIAKSDDSGLCFPGCAESGDCSNCSDDTDCGKGTRCNRESGRCETDCSCPLDERAGGIGVDTACAFDQACDPASERCRVACANSAECGVGNECVSGFCRPAPSYCNLATASCAAPCVVDGQCGPGQTCDVATGVCFRACAAAADCPSGACDVDGGTCVQDCDRVGCGVGLICDPVDGSCEASCVDGGRVCAADRLCDEPSGACVLRCDAAGAEACGAADYCDDRTGLCTTKCVDDATCAERVCDVAAGACVECLDRGDCAATEACVGQRCVPACDDVTNPCVDSVCDDVSGTCVECVETADCAAGVCDQGRNLCVGCVSNADCGGGTCDLSDNTCVECLSDADCGDGQRCNPANDTCVGCLTTVDCSGTDRCDAATNACVFECDPANNEQPTFENPTNCAAGEMCCPNGVRRYSCTVVGGC